MKILLIILLFLITCKLFAPGMRSLTIMRDEAIKPYTRMIKAIVRIESMNGKYLFDPKDGSVGWFHIRQIRLTDYDRRTGNHYTLKDCYDYEIAKKICLYYISKCDYRDIKSMSIAWNGKSLHNKYYHKILEFIEDWGIVSPKKK